MGQVPPETRNVLGLGLAVLLALGSVGGLASMAGCIGHSSRATKSPKVSSQSSRTNTQKSNTLPVDVNVVAPPPVPGFSRSQLSITTAQVVFLSRTERAALTDEEHLSFLESFGSIPEDSKRGEDWRDWHLATRTSWWGRKLDPKEFWKARPVWLDESAKFEALRHGRLYPPIPYAVPELVSKLSDDDVLLQSADPRHPKSPPRWSVREREFWKTFLDRHPKPPEVFEKELYEMAKSAMEQKYRCERGNIPNMTPEKLQAQNEWIFKAVAKERGLPEESVSYASLYWTYVLNRQREYQKIISHPGGSDSGWAKSFVSEFYADTDLLTRPLMPDELKIANTWKVHYLQKLRHEKTDESYIAAYLKAWNLSEAEVFAADQQREPAR
jgi:hypothetical protein